MSLLLISVLVLAKRYLNSPIYLLRNYRRNVVFQASHTSQEHLKRKQVFLQHNIASKPLKNELKNFKLSPMFFLFFVYSIAKIYIGFEVEFKSDVFVLMLSYNSNPSVILFSFVESLFT